MPKNYSPEFKVNINATSASESPLHLIEINSPAFTDPVRIVSDTVDVTSNGDLYTAIPIDVVLPDDTHDKAPQAKLMVDNIGKLLTDEIEKSRGLEFGTCKISQILRSNPDHIEWSAIMDIMDVNMDRTKITVTLGYIDMLNKPGITVKHTPEHSPGLF